MAAGSLTLQLLCCHIIFQQATLLSLMFIYSIYQSILWVTEKDWIRNNMIQQGEHLSKLFLYVCVPVHRCIMYVHLYCTHKVGNVIPVLQCIWRPQCALRMNRSSVSWLSLQVNLWVVQDSLDMWLSLILVSDNLWCSQLPIDSRDQYLVTLIFGAILGNIITLQLSRLLIQK